MAIAVPAIELFGIDGVPMAAMPADRDGKPTKPIAASVCPENIPGELVSLDQWLVWKYRPKSDGEWTKPPYSAHTNTKADVTLTENYSSFDEALTAQRRMKADGIGFALVIGGEITFIDLDHCRDIETGAIDPWARAIVRRFHDAYVETSPSGTGLHIIVKGTLPNVNGIKRPVGVDGAHPKAAIEMYSGGRYATITGNVIDDGHRFPGDAQAEINELFAELNPEPEPKPQPALHLVSTLPIDITNRLNVARSAINGSAFVALYDHGDISAYNGDQSSADLALCSHLGFYLEYRPDLIDLAFRNSPLMRPKWDEVHRHDRATYGQMTIEKIVTTRGEAYAPRNPIDTLPTTTSKDSLVGEDVVPTKEIRDRFMTAAELCALVPEDPDWVARPYVVVGGVTELTGQIKSGKSTLLGYLAKRLVEGGDFLGIPTSPGPVVYLTEQTPTTFREILERSALTESNDLHILTWHDVRADAWPLVVTEAICKAKREGARVLIVDTLPQFAGLRGDTENNAGDALTAILPVQAAAQDGLAVIIVRHDRKTGGEVGSSSRGSSAFGGAVDIILQLKKAEGNARPTLRVLSALSRFDDTPVEITIERQDGEFILLEPKQAFERTRIKAFITDMAARQERYAQSLDDIWAEIPNAKRSSVNDALKELVTEGILQRIGSGTRGKPYLFWMINEPETVQNMILLEQKKPPKINSFDTPRATQEVSFGTPPTTPIGGRGGSKEILRPNGMSSKDHRSKAKEIERLLNED